MKKIILLFSCFLMAAATFAPAKKVSFDALQKSLDRKSIPVYSLNGKLFTGTTYDEYGANEMYREVTLKDGLIQKEEGWYFDGQKEREVAYQNGMLHGKFLIFHRSGNKYLEENYRDGAQEGRQYRYNCDGSLQYEWDSVGGMKLMEVKFEVKPCIGKCKLDEGC